MTTNKDVFVKLVPNFIYHKLKCPISGESLGLEASRKFIASQKFKYKIYWIKKKKSPTLAKEWEEWKQSRQRLEISTHTTSTSSNLFSIGGDRTDGQENTMDKLAISNDSATIHNGKSFITNSHSNNSTFNKNNQLKINLYTNNINNSNDTNNTNNINNNQESNVNIENLSNETNFNNFQNKYPNEPIQTNLNLSKLSVGNNADNNGIIRMGGQSKLRKRLRMLQLKKDMEYDTETLFDQSKNQFMNEESQKIYHDEVYSSQPSPSNIQSSKQSINQSINQSNLQSSKQSNILYSNQTNSSVPSSQTDQIISEQEALSEIEAIFRRLESQGAQLTQLIPSSPNPEDEKDTYIVLEKTFLHSLSNPKDFSQVASPNASRMRLLHIQNQLIKQPTWRRYLNTMIPIFDLRSSYAEETPSNQQGQENVIQESMKHIRGIENELYRGMKESKVSSGGGLKKLQHKKKYENEEESELDQF